MPTMPNPTSTQGGLPAASFLRLPTVMQITGLGRSTIYRLMADQRFPCPVRLACRAVGWRQSDIETWSEERPVLGASRPEPRR